MNAASSPDPQFIENIIAGLTYWQARTAELDDQAIGQLDAERQNLYRMVQYGLALPQTWRDTAVVILQSFNFIERRGYWQEWLPVLEKAIDWCDKEHILMKFRLLHQLGQLYRLRQQWGPGLAAHEAAETIAQQLEDEQMLAVSHCHLSEFYLRQRQYDKAAQHGRAALTQFKHVGSNERWIAITLNTLGELARFQGDLTLAEERLSQAVSYWRLLNKPVNLARALNDLATTYLAAEKFERAQTCYEEATTLLESSNNEFDKVMIQINLGVLHFRQDQWIDAEVDFRKANSAYLRRSPHIYYRALVANNLGNVLLKQDRLAEAAPYLQNAINLWRQVGDNLELANSLGTLAETIAAQGQLLDAALLYKEAILLLSEFPDDARAGDMQDKFIVQQKAISAKVKP